MLPTEFESRDSFVKFVAAQITAEESLSREVSEVVADFFAVEPEIPADACGHYSATLRYVVSNDDLKLVDALTAAAAAAAGAGYCLMPVSSATAYAVAVTGLVVAGMKVIFAWRQKGAWLTEEQCIVVEVLAGDRTPKPSTDIAEILARGRVTQSGKVVPGVEGWDETRVRRVLEQLTKVRARGGKVWAVVAIDGDGKWALADV